MTGEGASAAKPAPPGQNTPLPADDRDQPPEASRTERAIIAHLRHELRTPINAIIGYSEMLLEDAEQSDLAAFTPDLNRIQSAGRRLLALLEDLLDPGRIEASRTDVTSEEFGARVRHELRTPLNTAIGYAELLLENTEGVAGEEFVRDLRKIRSAAERLLDHLEHIISLSQIGVGQENAAIETLGQTSMVRDVVTSIRSLAADETIAGAESGTLLVVDDNDMNRDMLSRHLERQGHEVTVAATGRQALDLVATRQFDVVLLDVLMPGMNGYQVLRQIKADAALRHLPVIMISALDEIDATVRCIELGADDYLTKPFNPVLLKARIGACLEKKRLRDREQAYLEQLRIEREKSERLLLNVLPAPIAERLKREEGPIADSFDEVTIIFADLVDFTPLSAAIPAKELVVLLNDIFSAFDRLAERHGLEKIKTIGDAYMAVAGLPTPRLDHVEAAADMALDMLETIARIRLASGKPLSVRVGINTGSVVAGVIGTKKFIYDLWGDAVNTASRMESHGIPDGISVSTVVYERLRDRYLFEDRGLIQVKAKGEMNVFLLKARRPQVCS